MGLENDQEITKKEQKEKKMGCKIMALFWPQTCVFHLIETYVCHPILTTN